MAARDHDGDRERDGPEGGEASAPRAPRPILLSTPRVTPPARPPPPRPIPLERVAPPRAHASARVPVARGADILAREADACTGDVLKRAREARGISLDQVCDRTRISRQRLLNLEADRYDQLPAPVYLRGMLMALARELRLDGQRVARSYLEAVAAAARERGR